MATEMAVGLAIAQQIMQQQGGGLAPSGASVPELLSPEEVAKTLGVTPNPRMELAGGLLV